MANTSLLFHSIAIGLTVLAAVLSIASISSKQWLEVETKTVRSYQGLWKFCVEHRVLDRKECKTLTVPDNKDGDKYKATRAFTILAVLAIGLAGLSLIITFINKIFVMIFIAAMGGTVFCQMVAMAIFTDIFIDAIKIDGVSFGWSFALGWAVFPIAITSLLCGVALKLTSKE